MQALSLGDAATGIVMSVLNRPYFRDEEAAFTFLEGIVWPSGPVCPHCGVIGTAYKMTANPEKRIRVGLWKCRDCRKQFTVKVGTVFEHARLPLHKALQCAYLLCSSKKGISANQLSRGLEISLKAAWFLAHRVREAMRELHLEPLGGEGKTVEIDETYTGGLEKNKHRNKRKTVRGRGGAGKQIAVSLVERGGKVRSHHIASVSAKNLRPIVEKQIHEDTAVMSDTGGARVATEFKSHGMVNHGIGEYVRGEISTNTVEGFFSILKRGINGTYHHVSEAHLKRYLCEFDFRYNHRASLGVDDFSRTVAALAGITGKRVTYKPAVIDGEGEI
jgi:transposase-like protein